MVADEQHAHDVARVGLLVPGVVNVEGVHVDLADGDLVDDIVPVPGVGHVERLGVQVARLPFGQHEDGLDLLQLAADGVPEVGRHEAGHVTAEAVHVHLAHPPDHRLGHVPAHARLVEVKVNDVGPIPPRRGAELPLPVAGVPLRVLRRQVAVPGGVVGHPVEDDAQTQLVGGADELLQVVERAELRVDAVVVAHGVGATEGALAVDLADGMDGHEPDDAYAQIAQTR